MDILLERLINIGGAFLVLSLVVEKIADFLKLRNPALKLKAADEAMEKSREHAILKRNIFVGVTLAFVMKADAIQMLVSGVPGEVVGWENLFFYSKDRVAELSALNASYFAVLRGADGGFLETAFKWIQNLLGICVTGVALSFGSKFWHDLVSLLIEVKDSKSRMGRGNP